MSSSSVSHADSKWVTKATCCFASYLNVRQSLKPRIRGSSQNTTHITNRYVVQVESNVTGTVTFPSWDPVYAVTYGGVDHAAADALKADLQAKSEYFASLPTTPGATISNRLEGSVMNVYLEADGTNGNPRTWVFNLTNDLRGAAGCALKITGLEDGDSILINCRVADAQEIRMTLNSYLINGVSTASPFIPRLLWNFPPDNNCDIIISGTATFQGSVLVGDPDSTTQITDSCFQGRIATVGDFIHGGDYPGNGATIQNYPFTGVLPDLPGTLTGNVFMDLDKDGIRTSGDGSVTNLTVELINAGTNMTTVTSLTGDYRFENVPAGPVTVLVSRVDATLTHVPASADPERNRALPQDTTPYAYIAYTMPSGGGVLSEAVSEPLNAGFLNHPLSIGISLSVYADAEGVTIEIETVDENGGDDIEIYAWINDEWVEVGRVPSSEVYGGGCRQYTVRANGLTVGESYIFRVLDEAGHEHLMMQAVAVRRGIRTTSIRMEMQTAKMRLATEEGCSYVVKTSSDLVNWTIEYVKHPRAGGKWSKNFSNKPFPASPGTYTEVIVPVNGRDRAFFKAVKVD
jgi:choice-of-anchor A domain-containing protein